MTGLAWEQLAVVNPPAPVLCLLADSSDPHASPSRRVWAGGPGGLAWRARSNPSAAPNAVGEWATTRLPLRSVAALARCGTGLLAGGTHGIAWSDDEGRTWRLAETPGMPEPVATVAAFGSTAIAGTLGAGVLRSDDGGRRWSPATFGLPGMEIAALAWAEGESVVAGTDNGIAVSPNGGLAWRPAEGAHGVSIAGVVMTGTSGVAVGDDGSVLGTSDGGSSWERAGALPKGVEPGAVHVTSRGAFVVGAATGIWSSADTGHTWTRVSELATYCLAEFDGSVVAGTVEGPAYANETLDAWRVHDGPPVHDVSSLVVAGAEVFAYGQVAGVLRGSAAPEPLPAAPSPLVIEPDPAGGLVLSAADGLWRSDDGTEWHRASVDRTAVAHLLTIGADSTGWAAGADGLLLSSPDGGRSWKRLDAPWGTVEVVALRAMAGTVLAATFDRARRSAELWRTESDSGWRRSARVPMPTPAVVMCADPPAAVLDRSWFVRAADGAWQRPAGPGGAVLRLAGAGDTLFVLTEATLALSTDRGSTWQQLDAPPAGDVIDIAVAGNTGYALLTGGRLWNAALR